MQHRKKPAHPSRSKSNKGREQQATGAIRIISGQWRGRKLPVLNAEGLRPTTDRTKETLFNWLMQNVHGLNGLDAFSGSGSLGFEALSRGAKSMAFLEMNAQAAKQLKSNIALLKASPEQAQVYQQDTLSYLNQQASQSFDLIFIDPPFGQGLVAPVLEKIVKNGWLAPGGWVYLEMEQPAPCLIPEHWRVLKVKETPQFSYRLMQLGSDI